MCPYGHGPDRTAGPRQRQVILGQQQEPAQRHQILHRQRLGQRQPVHARHLHPARFQRPHHRRDEARAAAHQNHDVARPDGPALGRQQLAAFDPARNRACDLVGQIGLRVACMLRDGGQVPIAGPLSLIVRRQHRP
jgi:hypothetical protein